MKRIFKSMFFRILNIGFVFLASGPLWAKALSSPNQNVLVAGRTSAQGLGEQQPRCEKCELAKANNALAFFQGRSSRGTNYPGTSTSGTGNKK